MPHLLPQQPSTNPDAATWSCTGTLSNVQTAVTGIPAPTTALFVGRGIVRSSGTKSTVARIIDHSYIRSISGVTGTVTITGTRQYLTDGTEDVFTIASGDVLQVCGSEIEIGQWGGATAGSNVSLTRSAIDWSTTRRYSYRHRNDTRCSKHPVSRNYHTRYFSDCQ